MVALKLTVLMLCGLLVNVIPTAGEIFALYYIVAITMCLRMHIDCNFFFQHKMPVTQTHLLVEAGTQTAHYPSLNVVLLISY